MEQWGQWFKLVVVVVGVGLALGTVPRTADTACHHSTWEFRASLHYILSSELTLSQTKK